MFVQPLPKNYDRLDIFKIKMAVLFFIIPNSVIDQPLFVHIYQQKMFVSALIVKTENLKSKFGPVLHKLES